MRRPDDLPSADDDQQAQTDLPVRRPSPPSGTDDPAAVADAAVATAEAAAACAAADVAREAARSARAAVDAACVVAARAAQRALQVAVEAAEVAASAAAELERQGRDRAGTGDGDSHHPTGAGGPWLPRPDPAETAARHSARAELVARRVVVVAEAAATAALDAARVVAAQLYEDTAALAGEVRRDAGGYSTGRAATERSRTSFTHREPESAGADPALAGQRAVEVLPLSTPLRVATVGLVVVLLLLSVFSVTVAISNSRGTERAAQAVAESDLYERASAALLMQEELAEEVVAQDDAETRADYAEADLATASALQDLRRVPADAGGVAEVEALLEAQRRYGVAVEAMFDVARQGPGPAELYEDTYVDRHFDPLAATLDAHVESRYLEARSALRSVAHAQQQLQIATPALFGVALMLLTLFIVMLARSRRQVAVQADENRHQSLHDGLTGLPNRTVLHRRGAVYLEQAHVTGIPMALMLLDLDRFKEINDTLGHHHGDLVLQSVGERLRLAVRASDVVVRLGGDEFAILLPQVQDAAGALSVAGKVQEALQSSLDVGGILLDVDISMGVALSGLHGDDVETLLQHADIAMYRAKEHDLGVCVYDDDLNEHSRDQLGLLGELRRAIENDELVLHFQPKVALPDGEFCGAEALLRWDHPTRGLIPPGMFIPAAERTALIRPLTAWVLNAALAECKRWQDDGRALKLAVNVSARNLLDDSFGDDVLELLGRWDLPASCLVLEVTESAVMVDPLRAGIILRRFAKIGIELAIDDFGAGYTSLAHLRVLPVQELKIDQSLVRAMVTSVAGSLIIAAVIDLAHGLGLRTVAEGVEDAGTLQRLSALGCDVAQGYHLARPMPATELRAWGGVPAPGSIADR